MSKIRVPPGVDVEAFKEALLANLTNKTTQEAAEALTLAVQEGRITLEAAQAVLDALDPTKGEDPR